MADCCFKSPLHETCQFKGVAGINVYLFDTKEFCVLHAPVEIKNDWPGIPPAGLVMVPSVNEFISTINVQLGNGLFDFSGIAFPPRQSFQIPTYQAWHYDFSYASFKDECEIFFTGAAGKHFAINNIYTQAKLILRFQGDVPRILLKNCVFGGSLRIDSHNASIRILDFSGTKFNQSLELAVKEISHTARFDDVVFSKPIDIVETGFPQNTSLKNTQIMSGAYAIEAESSYRHLRKALAEHKARDEEGMVYIAEQRSARMKYKFFTLRKWTSYLYDTFSGYGGSYSRALIWLVITQFIAFFAYTVTSYYSHICAVPLQINLLMIFTITQLFKPFEILSSLSQVHFGPGNLFDESARAYLPYVAVTQSALSLILFTLFILALRRRFMRE